MFLKAMQNYQKKSIPVIKCLLRILKVLVSTHNINTKIWKKLVSLFKNVIVLVHVRGNMV